MKRTHWFFNLISGGSTYKSFRCAPPPQQDQILWFLHMFSPKSTYAGGWRPGWRPPPTGNPGSAPADDANNTSQSIPAALLYLHLNSWIDISISICKIFSHTPIV